MKKLNNLLSAFTFLTLVLATSSSYAVGISSNVNAMKPVVLASVITNNAISASNSVDKVPPYGGSNLFRVFGGSLVGLSLVMRRLPFPDRHLD